MKFTWNEENVLLVLKTAKFFGCDELKSENFRDIFGRPHDEENTNPLLKNMRSKGLINGVLKKAKNKKNQMDNQLHWSLV